MATVFQTKEQKQQQQKEITPEQELHRQKEAQELFGRLKFLLTEGESPALDILSETLQKVEELSLQTSHQPDLNPNLRKILEDISTLLLSARQLAKNKGISERLLRIGEESQKALKQAGYNKGVLPALSKGTEVTQDIMQFMNTWRPVFYLLVGSRDFRVLILDSIRIARRVLYNYTDSISDETSEQFIEGESAKHMAENIKEQVKEKGAPEMSDEEWDIIQKDIQRVLALLSKEPSYQQGIEKIFILLDMFQQSLLETPVNPSEVLPKDIHIRKIVGEAEGLVSSFSGVDALEDFKFHLTNLIRKTKEHQDLHNYLFELKEFILKTKSEAEVQSQEFKSKIKDLATRGRKLIRELKDDDDVNRFLDSANSMIENIKNDEFLQMLRLQAGIVQSDLSYVDTQGNLQVDSDILTNLQNVLLPVLVDALKYIPLPKITSSDSKSDICLDNIVLCSYDIIPENIRFHLETDSEFSLQDVKVQGTHTFLVIQLNKLRTELKNIEFYYKKKTFPSLEDSGRVTFRIKGEGAKLTLTYKIEQGPEDKVPRIMKGNASFDIKDLDIEFDMTTIKHTILVPLLTNLFKVQIKNQIEEKVESNLKSWIDKLGDLMTSTIGQANRPFLLD